MRGVGVQTNSNWHVELQPSFEVTLPSSQISPQPPWMTPSPQAMVVQLAVQVVPFGGSHDSDPSTKPSPQSGMR